MTGPKLLWDGPPPGSEGWSHVEQDIPADHDFGAGGVRNVVIPTLTAYLPVEPSPLAVIVCPGGAFHFVSIAGEGHDVAVELRAAGIAAYVLKYRVVPTPPDEEGFLDAIRDAFADMERTIAGYLSLLVADGERAIELVRAEGHEHVSFLGFSAGGRMGAAIISQPDRTRWPDSAGIVYAPSVRPDTTAPEDAVPLFVLAAADDPLGIEGSLDLHEAWRDAGRSVELHLFEQGSHGFGLGPTDLPVGGWLRLYERWLRARGPA